MDRELVDIDAVVDGGGVVQIRVSIGVADRHVRACAVVALVDGNDPLGREPVDRGDHRCGDEIAVRERQEVEPVVNDVELAGTLEHRGDVQALGDLGVDRRVLRPATRRGGVQGGRGDRVCGGEQRDVMARSHQPLGEQRGELLPRPVVTRWCPPRDRRQHGDSDRAAGLALDGNVLRLPGPPLLIRHGRSSARNCGGRLRQRGCRWRRSGQRGWRLFQCTFMAMTRCLLVEPPGLAG